MSEFLVITGLSGAGRSQAADALEDFGWFVVDNIPTTLIDKIAELASAPGSSIHRVALVIGTGAYQQDVLPALNRLRELGHRVQILFLEAPTDVLVRRYVSSRRPHPLGDTDTSVADAIEVERGVLEQVKAEADLTIDTGDLNVHQLKSRLREFFGEQSPSAGMQTTLTSFGYKHGLPLDVDLVIDFRFLPNPNWVESLRDHTGLDADVREYVLGQPMAGEFLERLDDLLELLIPAYGAEGKSYLTIAFGCTGGHHRSVAIAEEVGRRMRRRGVSVNVNHRDVTK